MKDNQILFGALAVAMAVVMALASVSLTASEESDATYEENWGQIYNMNLAPGYSYRYTPEYPEGLEVETTILQSEAGLDADILEGTLVVSLSDSAQIGTSYDLVLQAHSDTGGVSQTIYQHLRFTAVNGLQITPSQVINDIILGAELTFEAQATTGATTPSGEPMAITWAVKSGTELPAGLELNGNTVSGEPTVPGKNTVSLTASSAGQTADLIIDFTVWQQIVQQSDETIYSHGNTVSSNIVPQTVASGEDKSGDLVLTWAVAGDSADQLPSGFQLDPSTGIISGSSTESQTSQVKITGTHAASGQTVSKVVTISTEPVMQVSFDSESIFTYPDAEPSTATASVNSGVSTVTWSLQEQYTGVSIDPSSGVITVTNAASAGSVVVVATSAYGQTATGTIQIVIEEPLSISGADSVATSVGTPKTEQYTCNVSGVTWSVEDVPVGATITIDQSTGLLSVDANSPMDAFQITVKATSANGQTAEYEVTCQIVPQLAFSEPPTGGAIIYGI